MLQQRLQPDVQHLRLGLHADGAAVTLELPDHGSDWLRDLDPFVSRKSARFDAAPDLRISSSLDRWSLESDGDHVFSSVRPEDVAFELRLRVLDRIAATATARTYLHAGVVEAAGKGILIPGASFSGKTTLVGALIERGCSYLSDEYARLSPTGELTGVSTPMRVRRANGDRDVINPDTPSPAKGLRVDVVVRTSYEQHAQVAVDDTEASAALEVLIANCVNIRTAPDVALPTLAEVARKAVGLTLVRGEADDAAEALLGAIRQRVV